MTTTEHECSPECMETGCPYTLGRRPPTSGFMVWGLNVGHSCDDCERLTIVPRAVNTCGASYELVARITAGGTHDRGPFDPDPDARGHADIRIEDIPKVIAELQKIHDRAVQAEAEQRIPAEWAVD